MVMVDPNQLNFNFKHTNVLCPTHSNFGSHAPFLVAPYDRLLYCSLLHMKTAPFLRARGTDGRLSLIHI